MCKLSEINTNYGAIINIADIKKASISNIIDAASICDKIDYIYSC